MDLAVLAVVALVITAPVVIWDLATANRITPAKEAMLPYTQTAYLVFFLAGFGLLLKFMSFAAVMLLATALTGIVWAWDWVQSRREQLSGRTLEASMQEALKRKVAEREQSEAAREPIWLELSKSFFPVILIVFFIRSFLVEPFKIPSGSMIPTLLVGDYILVNKFAYGIRLPVANAKLIEVGQPARGDVMVFRFPVDPSVDYIKRVIGLPGDEISYRSKRLTINGKPVDTAANGDYSQFEGGMSLVTFKRFQEDIDGRRHDTLVNPEAPAVQVAGVREFPFRDRCQYDDDGFTCTVPTGHYFAMGDNRDSSSDSRYWGFVPEENIVGKAFMIWMNFGQLTRIGHSIQ